MNTQTRAVLAGIGHHLPERMTDFIGRGEADVVMTPINYVDVHTYNFEQAALQPAREQGMGFLAMKVFGGAAGGFEHADDTLGRASELEVSFDHTALQDAIRYARSLDGVSGMVIGVGSMEELEEVAAWAAESSPLSAQEVEALRSLGATVAEAWAGRFG